ncbi:hypothetical protein NBRC116494_07060 [Aurantivibrio plasticivorans]
MILKGSQRGGARQMALHLLNGEQNEHVKVHQVRGFISDNVVGALNEIYAISKGTNCKQFMYSLSLNPPPEEQVAPQLFDEALKKIEEKLKLEGQPRVIVFHEKEGRRHAHCVWSRIDIDSMTAINMSYDRDKLKNLARSLFLEHGWQMPDGYRDKSKKSVFNFNRTEWEQAKRLGRKPADIKRELQDCWAVSDSKKGFEAALLESGYFLAQGDKRSYVVMDLFGEIYSLPRQLGLKKKDLEPRLGDPDKLTSVEQTKDKIAQHLSPLFQKFRDEMAAHHKSQKETLLQEKRSMTEHHRKIRNNLKAFHEKRWQAEEAKRAARFRKGFKGLWDKLSGVYWRKRKENEQQAAAAFLRDEAEKEKLIQKQLIQRQELQSRIDRQHLAHEKERKTLLRDLSNLSKAEQEMEHKGQIQEITKNYNGPEMEE